MCRFIARRLRDSLDKSSKSSTAADTAIIQQRLGEASYVAAGQGDDARQVGGKLLTSRPYQSKRGILDLTHTRLFTLNTLRYSMTAAGFEVREAVSDDMCPQEFGSVN
jgi:hypothetical protein